MIRGSNLGAPSAVDNVRLLFTMKATVTFGGSPPRDPLPDPLPPGWVRIPVPFQVMLPAEIMQPAAHGGRRPLRPGRPVRRCRSCRIRCASAPGRVGGPGRDGNRTWRDFGALFDALHDGSASPASRPVDADEPIAAERRDPAHDGIPFLRGGERVPPTR